MLKVRVKLATQGPGVGLLPSIGGWIDRQCDVCNAGQSDRNREAIAMLWSQDDQEAQQMACKAALTATYTRMCSSKQCISAVARGQTSQHRPLECQLNCCFDRQIVCACGRFPQSAAHAEWELQDSRMDECRQP